MSGLATEIIRSLKRRLWVYRVLSGAELAVIIALVLVK